MAKIKELPILERPREKAIRYGIDCLSNEELIAILIHTGTRQDSALDIAHTLYSDNRGLTNLFTLPYQALLSTKGIGPGKALILSACFELCSRYLKSFHGESGVVDSFDIYQRYSLKLKKDNTESFVLVVLNRKKEIIFEEILYLGSEYGVECQPMEIIRKVITHNGKYFYIIHNHPSGNCSPSKNDVILTTDIISASKKVKIPLLDHLIIGSDGYYSFTAMKKQSINPSNFN